MNDNPAIKGLIELIEKRYGLEVLDSHYVLVDEKFKQYNIETYDTSFNREKVIAEIINKLNEKCKYGQKKSN